MHSHRPSLLARDDTMFGVCEGLGEDLGLNSNLLRMALALMLFWSPVTAIGVYAGCGALVAATRWLVPDPKPPLPEAPDAAAGEAGAEEEGEGWQDYADAA